MSVQKTTTLVCSRPDEHTMTGPGGRFDVMTEDSLLLATHNKARHRTDYWLCPHCTAKFLTFMAGADPLLGDAEPTMPPTDPDFGVDEPTPEGPQAAYEIQADWGSNFHGKIIVSTDTDLTDWEVECDLAPGVQITNVWDGKLVRQSGQLVVFGPPDYNKVVHAGSTAAINFQANGSATGAVANLVVNVL